VVGFMSRPLLQKQLRYLLGTWLGGLTRARQNGGEGDKIYEGKSISKLQFVIEKRRMRIMTYKQHLFFDVISKQI